MVTVGGLADHGGTDGRSCQNPSQKSPDMPQANPLEPYSLDLVAGLPQMAAAPTTPRQKLRYARILKTAAGFAQRHLDTLSLADVASRADIPLGTLYRYFPSTTHLMLALHREQLRELLDEITALPGRSRTHALSGVAMEIFHMRVMQPAVEQALVRTPYGREEDTTVILREIDALAEKAVATAAGESSGARIVLHLISGLVHSVRSRRLSLFEAEQDLKKACSLLV